MLVPSRINENTRVGVDAESVYWSSGVGQYATDIFKTTVDGGPPTTIASGPDIVEAFAVGRDAVYWTTNTGKIWKVGLAGGEPTLVTQSGSPTEIAVDAANVYWLSPGGIMKVGVSGGQQRQLAPDQVASFAIDATNVYWVNGVGRLMKVGIDGGAPGARVRDPEPGRERGRRRLGRVLDGRVRHGVQGGVTDQRTARRNERPRRHRLRHRARR